MILDEIFEALKPSDMPTYLRRQQGKPDLTMGDVEKERPQGAFRFQVGNSQFMDRAAADAYARSTGGQVQPLSQQPQGNQPKPTHRVVDPRPNRPTAAFQDQASAEKYARTVNGRVEPISEEMLDEQEVDVPASMNPENRGALILTALQKDKEFARMSRRPLRFNMGNEQFLIYDPEIKNRILQMAAGYQKKGALPQFLLNLGQPDSLHYLLNQLEGKSGDVAVGGQSGRALAQRFAKEATEVKKKSEVAAGSIGGDDATARTQKMIARIRARQPQATSDIEALAYDIEDKRKRDQQDIDKLEREIDDLETDVKADLRKSLAQLQGRKGASSTMVKQIQATDQAQSDAIKKILDVDRDQQKAIDDLKQASKIEPAVEPRSDVTAAPAGPSVGGQPAAQTTAPAVKKTPVKKTSLKKTATKKPTVKSRDQLPLDQPQLDIAPAAATAPSSQPADMPAPTTAPVPSNVVDIRARRRGPQGELPLSAEEPFQPQAKTGTLGETRSLAVKRDENENIILDEAGKDACYHKVRSRYKVWPSAYASGALVQCRKKGAANWGTGGKKK